MAGRTTFIVAHRLSTLRTADRILVMEGGRIVAFAPHEELLDGCPTYQRLWYSQTAAVPGARLEAPGLDGRPDAEAEVSAL